jgi:hypothetical protein
MGHTTLNSTMENAIVVQRRSQIKGGDDNQEGMQTCVNCVAGTYNDNDGKYNDDDGKDVTRHVIVVIILVLVRNYVQNVLQDCI